MKKAEMGECGAAGQGREGNDGREGDLKPGLCQENSENQVCMSVNHSVLS